MAKILVAASSEPRAILERILAGHQLSGPQTMDEAELLLREGHHFDLIVCTVFFDESRMFDLLRLAKSTPEWRRGPLVCAPPPPPPARAAVAPGGGGVPPAGPRAPGVLGGARDPAGPGGGARGGGG